MVEAGADGPRSRTPSVSCIAPERSAAPDTMEDRDPERAGTRHQPARRSPRVRSLPVEVTTLTVQRRWQVTEPLFFIFFYEPKFLWRMCMRFYENESVTQGQVIFHVRSDGEVHHCYRHVLPGLPVIMMGGRQFLPSCPHDQTRGAKGTRGGSGSV